jgi:pantothenate kinase
MADAPVETTVEALAERVEERRHDARRCLVGLAGPPGAGKSTVAAELAGRLGGGVAVVGQDAFHLADDVLRRRGRSGRKGAPDTFDARGFLAALLRIRDDRGHEVWVPRFDRTIEDSIAQAAVVGPDDDVVIVEGNYLLVDVPPWESIAGLLSLRVYVDLDPATRIRRLIARHVAHGRSPAEAATFVRDSDELNARLVAATRDRADLVLRR